MSHSLAKDSMILMAGRAAMFCLSVITPMILVRLFSVEDYGEYRQAMLIITTAATILPLGMPNSLYYFFPHFPGEKGLHLLRTVALIAAGGAGFCLVTWIFDREVAVLLNNPSFHGRSLVVGMSALMVAFSTTIETALLADGEVLLSTKIMTAWRLLQVPVLLAGAYIGGINLLLQGFLFSLLCKSAYSLWFFRRTYRMPLINIQLGKAWPQIKYGLPLGLGATFAMMSASADKFIVSHCLGERMFAIYSVGCYELPVMIIVFSSIGDVFLPTIVKLKCMNLHDEVVKAWHRAIEQSMLVGIPVCVFFIAYAHEFISAVFTPKYIEAVPVFRVSLAVIFLESLRYGMITRGYGRTGFMLCISAISFLLMFPATYLGTKHFGMIGAVTAFIATRCLNVGAEILFSKYLLKLQWGSLLPFKYMVKIAVHALICLAVPMATGPYLFSNNWALLIYLMAMSFSSYLYLTNLTGFWTLESLPVPEKLKAGLKLVLPGRRTHNYLSA